MYQLGLDKVRRVYHAIQRHTKTGIYLGDKIPMTKDAKSLIEETGVSATELRSILIFLIHVKAIEKRRFRYYVPKTQPSRD